MRQILALILSIVTNAFAASSLTITPADNGTDLLWLSWTDEEDTGIVARYDGATFESSRVFPDCLDGVSSTITEDPSGGMHLMFSKRDTLFSLDASGSMNTQAVHSFENMSEWCRTGLLRRSASPGFGLLGFYRASYMSSGADFNWQTIEYTVSESGAITLGDSLILEDPYPVNRSDYRSDYTSDFMFAVYPVMNASGYPVMATRQFIPGGPMPPTRASWRVATFCHNTTASALYLTADTLTWSTNQPESPMLVASGSSASTAVFLWSDSTETMQYSLHDCETGIVSTSPFPGQGPHRYEAVSISANPQDPGMLLVWNDGTDILARHYQNGWNDYAYVIAENVYGLYHGNISVCSTQDGYWVGYVAYDKANPVVLFVDRDDVTSIESQNGRVDPVSVRAFPNPFHEVLSIHMEGAQGSFKATLFDHTGRVTREGTSSSETLLWNTDDLPVGSYLIRITSGDNVYTEKAVLIR